MRKFFGPTGSVNRITVESEFLKTNMLGDPSARVVDVYFPAGHDGQGLPLLVDLVGFTGSGLSHTNWIGFRENLPERLDRLIGKQRMPPVVVAFPDCFTRLGGNQYINSASMGACLGGSGLSFRRYGLRAVLSARHAGGPARPRWCGELHRALVAATRSRQKASGGFLQGDQRASDGGQLRSRSHSVPGDPAAGHVRHLRGYRG